MANIAVNFLRLANFSLTEAEIRYLVPSVGYGIGPYYPFHYVENDMNGQDWFFTSKWGYADPIDLQSLLKKYNIPKARIWCVQAGEGPDYDLIYSVSRETISPERRVKYAFDTIAVEFHEVYLADDSFFSPGDLGLVKNDNIWEIKIEGYFNILHHDEDIDDVSPEWRETWDYELSYGPVKTIKPILESWELYYKQIWFNNKNETVLTLFKGDHQPSYNYRYPDKKPTGHELFHYDKFATKFSWNFCGDDEYLKWFKKENS
jgi:hypothetical protein